MLSNDPSTPAANDPTVFIVATFIPTLSPLTLTLLGLALAAVAIRAARS